MEAPIPEQWKKDVCSVLKQGYSDKIMVRLTSALRPFMDAFPGSFPSELHEAVKEALEQPDIIGVEVTDMDEPGQTYKFLFTHQGRPLYGKVCLCPDRQSVIIFSAH